MSHPRFTLALLMLFCAPSLASAQIGRTTPVGGYSTGAKPKEPSPLEKPRTIQLTAQLGGAFGGKIEGTEGRLSLEGGPSFGVTAAYGVSRGGQVRLAYSQQKNQLFIRNNSTGETQTFDMAVHSLQFGGGLTMSVPRTKGRLWPYFGLSLGATQWQPDTGDLATTWTFSWMAEGGATFWLFRNLGLTALIRWHGHVVEASNAAFCTNQNGGCVVLRSTELVFQGEAGGGLTLAF